MFTIEELLLLAKEKGASDLHITVGIPPKCRVHGTLINIGLEKLLPKDTDLIIQPMLSEYSKQRLEKTEK